LDLPRDQALRHGAAAAAAHGAAAAGGTGAAARLETRHEREVEELLQLEDRWEEGGVEAMGRLVQRDGAEMVALRLRGSEQWGAVS
jgi:hypothetical protein